MKYILKKSLDIKQQELQGSTSTFQQFFFDKHQNPHIIFVLEKKKMYQYIHVDIVKDFVL